MSFAALLQSEYQRRLAGARGAEKTFREKAWADYLRLGLPDRKTETWKYTSVESLNQSAWLEPQADALVPPAVLPLLQAWKANFDIAISLNGRLRLEGFKGDYALSAGGSDFTPAFADGLANAVAATHRSGFSLHVKKTARRPLLLIHCLAGEAAWSSTLDSIRIEAGAELRLVELFIGDQRGLRTGLVQVEAGKGAALQWTRLQQEAAETRHFADLRVRLDEAARCVFHQIHAGAGWARSTVAVELAGERAEAHIHGLTFAKADHHVDQRVEANHRAAHSISTQLFKGILKDRSRGILNGKIHIARGAQKVVSSQVNHNLLLNDGAEADTKPELEIFADDVKANHGATIGRLDEEKVFYLESRGIPREIARQLLAQAFVGDVLMKIPEAPVRELVLHRVSEVLADYTHEMENLQ